MKRLLLATLVLLGAARFLVAQGNPPGTAGAPAPDCYASGQVTATGRVAIFNNGNTGCVFWHVVYQATSGAASISVELDNAPYGTTIGSVGSWSAMPVPFGVSNPLTSTPSGEISGFSISPWVSINFGTLSAGSVTYQLLGFRLTATTQSLSFGTNVVLSPNSTVITGQQAVTGSAVALASNTVKTLCVKALVGNAINVYIGPSGVSTSTGHELAPGESQCTAVSNTNLIFVVASTTGASVSWFATN